MSIYAQAVSSGVSSLQLMATGDNAATRAAYNQAYSVAAQRASVRNARHAAQLNIAAIAQDKILSNTRIRLAQDRAQAAVIVNAAAAGVEGSSVDDIIYNTERNEAFALQSASRQAEIATDSQLAMIGTQTSALNAIRSTDSSIVGDLISGFSSFELSDLQTSDALLHTDTVDDDSYSNSYSSFNTWGY